MVYIVLALLILSIDLIIKSKITDMPLTAFPVDKLGGKVKIVRTYNEGMAYNIMEQNPEKVKKVSSIILLMFTILSAPMLFSKKTRAARKLGIALIIGGASSNVADRITKGKVVDYIRLNLDKQGRMGRITYNLADFCIVAGTVLYGIGKRKKTKRKH